MSKQIISINVNCPRCGKSLMDHDHQIDGKPGIKLLIKTEKGTSNIWLSSMYSSYNFISDIELEKGQIYVFSCPFCNSEITSEEHCDICKASMSFVVLDMGGKINFCSRRGCNKHSMEFEDVSMALKKLYEDFDSYSSK